MIIPIIPKCGYTIISLALVFLSLYCLILIYSYIIYHYYLT